MSRYLIEHIDCGLNDGGDACGPVSGPICTCIKYKKDDEHSRWLELDDVDGLLQFYLADKDLFDFHVHFNAFDDEKAIKRFNDNYIEEFEGIELSAYSNELFDLLNGDQKDNPATMFLKYIIFLARCSDEDLKKAKETVPGKFIDEIDVPMSEAEQDYFDGME